MATRYRMRCFFKQFSFLGGIGSHATPETQGSIHEGGELGYSIAWQLTLSTGCLVSRVTGAGVREALLNRQIAAKGHAHQFGVDRQDITNWKWPF